MRKYWVTCADNNGNVILNHKRTGDYEAVKFFAEYDTSPEFHGNICITEIEEQTSTRKQLQEEFISLRNALMVRPKGHQGKRARDIYFDHLNDSDGLAEIKTDEELTEAIASLKKRTK